MNELIEAYTDDYNTGYSDGYKEGYRYCKEQQRKRAAERRERKIEEARRFRYFLKQKLIGVGCLAFTALAVKLMDGDATIALITIPLGLMLIFSKDMCWMDNYFYEVKDREAQR